ncbi:MAG: hypothetical protein ACP5QP_03470 [Brevinematia bacterium]
MEFVLFTLIIVLAFIVIFLYARLYEEIKNVKGRGVVDEIKKEIESLIVEFNKVSNRKIIVMDEKIKEIENLVKLADERILKLDSLTRNYTELIKRYEIAKRDFQNALTDFNKLKEVSESRISKKETENTKRSSHKQSVRKSLVSETTQLEDKSLLSKASEEESDRSKISFLREEVSKMDIENMDFENRAELLRKLVSSGFDDYELIKLGFTESEISLAKILISNKS